MEKGGTKVMKLERLISIISKVDDVEDIKIEKKDIL